MNPFYHTLLGVQKKKEVLAMYAKMYKANIDIPMRIGNQDVKTGDTATCILLTIINTY